MRCCDTMRYCEACRATFFEPAYIAEREYHRELDGCPCEFLYLPICPECGSDDIDDCPSCDACGVQVLPEDLTDGLCPDCAKALDCNAEAL